MSSNIVQGSPCERSQDEYVLPNQGRPLQQGIEKQNGVWDWLIGWWWSWCRLVAGWLIGRSWFWATRLVDIGWCWFRKSAFQSHDVTWVWQGRHIFALCRTRGHLKIPVWSDQATSEDILPLKRGQYWQVNQKPTSLGYDRAYSILQTCSWHQPVAKIYPGLKQIVMFSTKRWEMMGVWGEHGDMPAHESKITSQRLEIEEELNSWESKVSESMQGKTTTIRTRRAGCSQRWPLTDHRSARGAVSMRAVAHSPEFILTGHKYREHNVIGKVIDQMWLLSGTCPKYL